MQWSHVSFQRRCLSITKRSSIQLATMIGHLAKSVVITYVTIFAVSYKWIGWVYDTIFKVFESHPGSPGICSSLLHWQQCNRGRTVAGLPFGHSIIPLNPHSRELRWESWWCMWVWWNTNSPVGGENILDTLWGGFWPEFCLLPDMYINNTLIRVHRATLGSVTSLSVIVYIISCL